MASGARYGINGNFPRWVTYIIIDENVTAHPQGPDQSSRTFALPSLGEDVLLL
jgi:hypothetical protein